MDLQNPKVQRILLASIVSVLILYVFFGSMMMGFTYRARKAEIAELRTQYDALSRDLERARLTAKNLPKLEQEYQYLHEQWKIARNLLPEQNEMEPLLRKISAAGAQAGLEFVNFKPSPAMRREYYTENPIAIEVEGNFHQMGTFLGQIANLNRIVNIRNLKLEGVDPQDQGDDKILHSMVGELEVVAYTVTDGGAAPAGAGDLQSEDKRLGRAGSTMQKLNEKRAEAKGSGH